MAENDKDQVLVRAKRPFEGVEGYKDEGSEAFLVGRRRAAELKASELVDEVEAAGIKQAPAPDNKMAAAPANKVQVGRDVKRA